MPFALPNPLPARVAMALDAGVIEASVPVLVVRSLLSLLPAATSTRYRVEYVDGSMATPTSPAKAAALPIPSKMLLAPEPARVTTPPKVQPALRQTLRRYSPSATYR